MTGEVTDLAPSGSKGAGDHCCQPGPPWLCKSAGVSLALVVFLDLWNVQKPSLAAGDVGVITEGDEDEQGDIELELEAPMGGRIRSSVHQHGWLELGPSLHVVFGAGPFGGAPEYSSSGIDASTSTSKPPVMTILTATV